MSKGYDFYIDGLLLPITPSAIDTRIANKNKVVTLLNGEELNLLKKPKLTEFEFECRLPNENYPAVKQFIPVQTVLDKLEDLKKNKKSFQFIIIRTPYEQGLNNSINKKVTLEEYEIQEDVKNGPDLIVQIKLKQYIPLKTKVVNTKADSNKGLVATRDTVDKGLSAVNVIAGVTGNPILKGLTAGLKVAKDAGIGKLFGL